MTSTAGLQAIAFWALRGDFSLTSWIPNLFLLLFPIPALVTLTCGAAPRSGAATESGVVRQRTARRSNCFDHVGGSGRQRASPGRHIHGNVRPGLGLSVRPVAQLIMSRERPKSRP
ncbi:DUF5360 family protein [Nocardia sp. NPDC051463]|uniref:DUF5360 family protein n=1 Tax=Nocardia sp. NPDC051463 TaxID=3154845 RepID=UPI00345004C3